MSFVNNIFSIINYYFNKIFRFEGNTNCNQPIDYIHYELIRPVNSLQNKNNKLNIKKKSWKCLLGNSHPESQQFCYCLQNCCSIKSDN